LSNNDLTALANVPGFSEPICMALAPYWITTAEEFAATARLENAQYGDGLSALGAVLKLNADNMESLYTSAVLAAPRAAAYSVFTDLNVGTGLLLDHLTPPSISGQDFAPPRELPTESKIATLPPILDQGKRNTCVAFSMVTMYQLLIDDLTALSEQFLFWGCKQLDDMPSNPTGTTPDAAIQALKQYGVCLERDWPYQPEPVLGNVGQDPPSQIATRRARARRIAAGGALESTGSRAVRMALADGQPVLLGLPCYAFWINAGQARRAGRLRRELPGEHSLGGHAVCAVGYRDDPIAPGGGYIIIRNSWGGDWGSENLDGAGYGHVPYDLVDTQNKCAYVLDRALRSTSEDQE
jgi:hypothetical protein